MVILQTNKGNIHIKLDFDNTPATANNFLAYVKDSYYDGCLFHRVINGFMIQGGGFEPGMLQKQTKDPIENEADKGGSNTVGSIAMARTNDPHSATAQFFINVKDNHFLDFKSKDSAGWGYCVFGEVVEGIDVVKDIETVSTTTRSGHSDVPVEDVIINKVVVED